MRDYQPDDDVRQINWQATARVGRPMSNQYRIEQDRDVVCLLDAGRLMAAPLAVAPVAGGGAVQQITRLDAAVDAGATGLRPQLADALALFKSKGLAVADDDLADLHRAGHPPQFAGPRRRFAGGSRPGGRAAKRSCARSSTSSRHSSTATMTSRSAPSAGSSAR